MKKKPTSLFWLPLIAGSLSAASPPVATELSIVQNGETVGHVRSTQEGDRIRVDYLVDSNGRGPRHREDIRLGPGQIPVVYEVEGRSLMGGPVSERFSWDRGRAVWTSQADQGERSADQPPLYVINDGSPFTLGIYARALLADEDRRIDVLPGGTLRLERLRDVQLGSGPAAIQATIYRIDGIDLAPAHVMLDRDHRLVATLGTGSVAVLKGLESEVPAINALAEELQAERARTLQSRLAHRFSGPVQIRNVRLFDPETRALTAPSTVVVHGERIAEIRNGVETGDAAAGEYVIDGEGGTLVPGLHDMHSHNSLSSGLFYLAAGVTSVRDMGNDNDFLTGLMSAIDEQKVAGPRITRNGFLEGRSPHSARLGIIAQSEQEAVDAVRHYAENGFRQIKIYNSMNPAWVPAITSEAHRRGLTVTGHIPAFTTPDEMIRAGYDEIAHINQLMLGWLIRPGEDTRTPLRLTAMARAANLDLSSAPVQETVRLMRDRRIPLDTTAVILERLMLSRAGTVAEGDAFYLDHMPIGYQRYRRRSFVEVDSPEADAAYRGGFQRLLEVLNLLHRNQVRLLPGTDDATGFTVQRELELYQKAGIPAGEVLRIATLDMADYLGRAEETGSITPGKYADFFLVAGDPTRDVAEIRRPRLVMRGGVAYFPSEIYSALGIEPFAEPVAIRQPGAAR